MTTPDRGDLVWLDFSPQSGHEQAGHRPALVLTKAAFNQAYGLAIVCPITSRIRGMGAEVALPEGLPVQGAVLVQHLKSIDWISRRLRNAGQVPSDVMEHVLAKVGALFA